MVVTVEETEREENAAGGFLSGCEIKRSGKMDSRAWLAGLLVLVTGERKGWYWGGVVRVTGFCRGRRGEGGDQVLAG